MRIRYCADCGDPLPPDTHPRAARCGDCTVLHRNADSALRKRRWRQRHPDDEQESRVRYWVRRLERFGYKVIPPATLLLALATGAEECLTTTSPAKLSLCGASTATWYRWIDLNTGTVLHEGPIYEGAEYDLLVHGGPENSPVWVAVQAVDPPGPVRRIGPLGEPTAAIYLRAVPPRTGFDDNGDGSVGGEDEASTREARDAFLELYAIGCRSCAAAGACGCP